jgi:hypothetical protein
VAYPSISVLLEQGDELPLVLRVRKDLIVDMAICLCRAAGVCRRLLLRKNNHPVRFVNGAIGRVIDHHSRLLFIDPAGSIPQEALRSDLVVNEN